MAGLIDLAVYVGGIVFGVWFWRLVLWRVPRAFIEGMRKARSAPPPPPGATGSMAYRAGRWLQQKRQR